MLILDLNFNIPSAELLLGLMNTLAQVQATTNTATMAESNHQAGECRLLALPPELRNCIYRYTLLEDGQIEFEKNVEIPLPPALLQTSHQVRTEAHNIYYRKNIFLFRIKDFDASLYIRWCALFPWNRSDRIEMHSSTNFDNLLQWMHALFNVKCAAPGGSASPGRNIEAALALFDMVRCMRRDRKHSWDEAEALLRAARAGFAALDPAWAA